MTTSTERADRPVVVLTGASSGIARATAREFAGRGYDVTVAARDQHALEEVAAECEGLGARALAVVADVSHEDQVQRLAHRTHETFGRVDVWVNSAAVIAYGEFEQVPSEVYRQVLETNMFGQIHGARAVLPHFRERGSGVLINVGSVRGTVTSPYVSSYVVSKFAVRAFSESLQQAMRLDPGTRNIRVCTVLPQSVDTPIFRHAANYTGRQAKPVPPVVDPQRVVRAIVKSAERPRRSRNVGTWGRLLELGHAVAPSVMGRVVPAAMNHTALGRGQAAPTVGNVFDPMPGWNTEQGHWRNRVLRYSTAGALAATTAAVAAWTRRSSG